MSLSITFLGGVGTVTGSKYLLKLRDRRILVDCGLFQGWKQLRLRNWAKFPVDPARIDAIVLTHAHLDHSGHLPILVRDGFKGPILATPGTRDLCGILLPDSGFLQEKDAEFANRHGFSKHHPAKPLYTQHDADVALERFRTIAFEEPTRVGPFHIRFLPAGHILGAAIVEVVAGDTRIVFSGDLGRTGSPTMNDPAPMPAADYLLVESTYGDRTHDGADPEDALADVINRTVKRGGRVLVPAFAVGRTQTLLYHLDRLKAEKRIPDLPVFLDSPMAIDATTTYRAHPDGLRLSAKEVRQAFGVARYVTTVEESKALAADKMPKIVISASGMATGGRVLHHLEWAAPDHRNTILFAGYQAGGTRGAALCSGAETIKLHGHYLPVRAEVDNLHMLSVHADANEIMAWLRTAPQAPRTVFVTHGEPDASDTLRHRIEEELGWSAQVPEQKEKVDLS